MAWCSHASVPNSPAMPHANTANTAGKIALVTGITGQDGSYLAELLLSKGYTVHGIVRRSSGFNTDRIDALYPRPARQRREAVPALRRPDRRHGTSGRCCATPAPTRVYNLAAQSHVRVSFDSPVYTVSADALGTNPFAGGRAGTRGSRRASPSSSTRPAAARCTARSSRRRRARRRRSTRAARTRAPSSTATGRRSTTARATACSRAAASCSTTKAPAAARRS